MSFEDKGDSLASDGLFTPFFVSLHISPLPLPRLLLPHDFPGIFYADFDVAVAYSSVNLVSYVSPTFAIRGVDNPLSQENQGVMEKGRHYRPTCPDA